MQRSSSICHTMAIGDPNWTSVTESSYFSISYLSNSSLHFFITRWQITGSCLNHLQWEWKKLLSERGGRKTGEEDLTGFILPTVRGGILQITKQQCVAKSGDCEFFNDFLNNYAQISYRWGSSSRPQKKGLVMLRPEIIFENSKIQIA